MARGDGGSGAFLWLTGDSILVRLRIGGKVARATVISRTRAVAANKVEAYR
jgi:hypothetical protein